MNKIIISAPWTVHPPIVRLTPALKINFTSQSNKTQFNSFCYRLVLRNVLIQTVHKSKKKTLTAAVLITDIWKSPNVTEVYRKPNN